MKKIKTPDKDSVTLFRFKFLESLTRTHIAVPVGIFLVYAFALLYWSIMVLEISSVLVFLLFFSGILLFSWVEYQVHRHLFHMRPTSERRRKLQFIIHGVHHQEPKDKKRLAMPPVLSVTIATLLLILLKYLSGDFSFSILAGFLTGYAGYLLVHYIVHVFSPPNNIFRVLWIYHSIHHYKDNNKAFGVSSPLWDYIYKTMP